MKPIDVEYAIKKDVRNNPIVREADRSQHIDFLKTSGIWALILAMVLFSAWQHFQIQQHNYQTEGVQREYEQEQRLNRQLRLGIETLKSPERIEQIATEQLKMVVPSDKNTIVLQRVPSRTADKSIVARAGATGTPR